MCRNNTFTKREIAVRQSINLPPGSSISRRAKPPKPHTDQHNKPQIMAPNRRYHDRNRCLFVLIAVFVVVCLA